MRLHLKCNRLSCGEPPYLSNEHNKFVSYGMLDAPKSEWRFLILITTKVSKKAKVKNIGTNCALAYHTNI